ncbi:MAG: ATP-dependent Clp protease adaptor ClpS [Planctomycetota bacterium]
MSAFDECPGTVTLEETESLEEVKVANLWKVICHDDPHTTMDFVVDVLVKVFRQPSVRAVELMMRVHTTGSALIGLWPESVARKKVNRAHAKARALGYPLTFSIEEDV